jgi:hypothetical protein
MISGTTSHKLDKIRTYSQTDPYVIGTNGVTNIDYDGSGNPTKIYYDIDDIIYESNVTTLNRFIDNNRSLVNLERGTKINAETIFNTSLPSYSNFLETGTTFLREEAKIGLVFPIKTEDEIFIERQYGSVLEQHSRLSEIKSLERLINYRNGYYNIKDNF